MPEAISAFGYNTIVQPIISSANLITGLTLAGAAGTSGQVLTSAGSGLPTWSTAAALTLGTPVATNSGTSIDFTGIPAGTKQIIITFSGVSTGGTNVKAIQIGDSGGIEIADYEGVSHRIEGATPAARSATDLFPINSIAAADNLSGSITLTLENSTAFRWSASGVLCNQGGDKTFTVAGRKALSGTLDRIRLTTTTAFDTFDGGEINIAYI